jgi:hypothetical protein
MTRRDVFWDEGPEYEKPEELADPESQAERMRRLNKAFAEDYVMLHNNLFGAYLPTICTNERERKQ